MRLNKWSYFPDGKSIVNDGHRQMTGYLSCMKQHMCSTLLTTFIFQSHLLSLTFIFQSYLLSTTFFSTEWPFMWWNFLLVLLHLISFSSVKCLCNVSLSVTIIAVICQQMWCIWVSISRCFVSFVMFINVRNNVESHHTVMIVIERAPGMPLAIL